MANLLKDIPLGFDFDAVYAKGNDYTDEDRAKVGTIDQKHDKEFVSVKSVTIAGCGLPRHVTGYPERETEPAELPDVIGCKAGIGYIEDGQVYLQIYDKRFYSIVCVDDPSTDWSAVSGPVKKVWFAVEGQAHPFSLYRSYDGKTWQNIHTFQFGPEAYEVTTSHTEVVYDSVNRNLIVHASAIYRENITLPTPTNYKEYFWYSSDQTVWKVMENDAEYQPRSKNGGIADLGIGAMTAFNGKVYALHTYSRGHVNVLRYSDGNYDFEKSIMLFPDEGDATICTIPNLMVAKNGILAFAAQNTDRQSQAGTRMAYTENGEDWNIIYFDRSVSYIPRSIDIMGRTVYVGFYSDGRIYSYDIDSVPPTESVSPIVVLKDALGAADADVNGMLAEQGVIRLAVSGAAAGIYSMTPAGELVGEPVTQTVGERQLLIARINDMMIEMSKLSVTASVADMLEVFGRYKIA